ncbi:hypothetical protein PUR61_01490 [Streptomyces sp. BE20]|uniref:hypothetical protein n=1 Tax=unclassified Streptomyces TaxID=2593676 RepID=UPI002E788C86|nr:MULTISPECIES: hypothetical protein [unclassified Streptomyces]MED7947578.1 hypothetical protein [Streptomyces sp. BE303]MEE1820883.1 hypothetical protein [Streptomyces sp. BE20]
MNALTPAPANTSKRPKPEWFPAAALTGALNAVLASGPAWSWRAWVWTPLLILAVGCTLYAWQLMSRDRSRMNPLDWTLLTVTHLGLAASLVFAAGLGN